MYCASLRSTPIYDFDMHEDKSHRCKVDDTSADQELDVFLRVDDIDSIS